MWRPGFPCENTAVMMSMAGVLAEPVLVGREKELQELRSFLETAIEGKGKTVFVSGEAGSGKTRLVKEFLNTAKQKIDLFTLAGSCLSNAAVPYFPFFEAFTNYFTTENSEEQEVKSWLMGPIQNGKHDTFAPQVWKDQTFIAVTKTLSSISDMKPVILFLEDVHWADSASLGLIHYLARAISDKRILILATYRSEGLTTDAEGHPHPLAETLRQMRREDIYKEVKLSNLNQTEISAIGKSMLGGKLQVEFAEKLAKESQGNSLYVIESLRMLHEQDRLTQELNEWRLSTSELGIPGKIKDIILQRLSPLARNQRRVLDAASVIGEKFDVELLGAVLGQDTLDVLETLNAVAQSTALVSCAEGSFKFDHAKSRDAIYEEIPLALKKGYHTRIAQQMESASKDGKTSFSDLAYHYAQAGHNEKAVKYALIAGEDALARWSNEEAIKHFRFVLQTLPENPENAASKTKAQEGLGDAYFENNMFKQATKTFEDLSNSETGLAKLRALRKAMFSTWQYQDGAHLMELVKKAEPYAAADRLENARVLLNRGRAYNFRQGMQKLALEDWEAALRVFEEEYSLWDVGAALLALGPTHANLDASLCGAKKGIAESLRAFTLYEELRDFRVQMAAGYFAGQTFIGCMLPNEALGMFAKVMEIGEKTKIGASVRLFYAYAFSSRVCERMGDWEEALSHSLKALELSKITDTLIAPAMAYSNLTRIYVRLGDLKRAEEYFEKLMEQPQEKLLHPWVLGGLTKAVFFAGKGRWKESNQCFKEFIEKNWPSPGATLAKLWFAWVLKNQGRSEEARVILEDDQRAFREADERFDHVCLQASLMVRREVSVGEEFEMHLDFVNVSKKPGFLAKVEALIPSEGVKVTALPPWCNLQNGGMEMMNMEIGAFKVVTAKLTLRAVKTGAFTLKPKVEYLDDLGVSNTSQLDPISVTVKPPQPSGHVAAGRVSSGLDELDDLLGGGIPENYAVVLASPSSDERNLLIKRFLEAGAETDQTTFYLTTEAGNEKALAEKYPSNFYLFLCNPRADTMMQSLPNVVKLKGVENLTEIDIALTKAFRTLNPSANCPKRVCVEIICDALLQHHAVVTRKWLSGLLADLKAKGFTTIAVLDPQMHPPEESRAIISLFDGEIAITEKETAKGTEKILRIRKLVNQKYPESELTLTKEKLSSKATKNTMPEENRINVPSD